MRTLLSAMAVCLLVVSCEVSDTSAKNEPQKTEPKKADKGDIMIFMGVTKGYNVTDYEWFSQPRKSLFPDDESPCWARTAKMRVEMEGGWEKTVTWIFFSARLTRRDLQIRKRAR